MSKYKERNPRLEVWIDVDTETSGPAPSVSSLLSIGACVVGRLEARFYVELQPLPDRPWSVEAEGIHGLSQTHLAQAGLPPQVAMQKFADWLEALPEVVAGQKLIFNGFNASFDWLFVADYFWRYLNRNPFGISAPDTKGLYYGLTYPGTSAWSQTAKSVIFGRNPDLVLGVHTHNALDDAVEQAALLENILAKARAGTLK
jgi:ribonuclease T